MSCDTGIKPRKTAKTGHFTKVSSADYKGKWAVICFYPADFTFSARPRSPR
jgi:alkyl hydroperoxide reductase subunit AhpC